MPDPNTPAPEGGTLLKASPAGDAAAVIDAARRATEPKPLDTTEYYAVPGADGDVEVLDLERYRPAPDRARGVYRPATVQSFIAYVNAHADEEHSTVWVHPTEGRVVCVLNDHSAESAEWGDHRVELTLLVTDEWKFWLARDGQLTGQEEFAEHIEDGVRQIVEPEAATMLEIAQSIHATTKASFRSATRLADGEVQMAYDEEVEASAGRKGELSIPREFVLALPPFVGEEPYKLTARLRYRLNSGTLRIGYRLDQPDAVVRDALEHIAGTLGDQFKRVYMGTPSTSAR
jgi:uncharacterized protein YfdQ (DUF2303 family)